MPARPWASHMLLPKIRRCVCPFSLRLPWRTPALVECVAALPWPSFAWRSTLRRGVWQVPCAPIGLHRAGLAASRISALDLRGRATPGFVVWPSGPYSRERCVIPFRASGPVPALRAKRAGRSLGSTHWKGKMHSTKIPASHRARPPARKWFGHV